jgi:cytochrome c biogenesis protein CcdA
MTNGRWRELRDISLASATYCGVCFFSAAAIYLAIVFMGKDELLVPGTMAVEHAVIPTRNFLISSLFVGGITMVFCLGGLLGLWTVVAAHEQPRPRLIISASLFALIAAGVFMLGTSVAEDYLFLRAASIAILSLSIAMLVNVNSRDVT